ncbi:hypothetical protein DACRYDRAFT_21850 [Dacryopinax primogenitus]|uniref:Uncharacterized protein n=1 Tax=Dacryopinax primogenitus (strain DJM 731) TaxID=1858805 RepID=M5GAE8_DACPD|nr:uncharacterized protein DACRYDRAFT_21850 [Dacryopinax primogenitus]EJU02922.1 hypothetical protein DACRYDRAFT_21850 [Dacryopinax primogenitus]
MSSTTGHTSSSGGTISSPAMSHDHPVTPISSYDSTTPLTTTWASYTVVGSDCTDNDLLSSNGVMTGPHLGLHSVTDSSQGQLYRGFPVVSYRVEAHQY